jgi:hypothetical protein
MPKKTGHNCAQCSKLGNIEAQAKPCWDGESCPNRRYYHRHKQRISLERKVARSARLEGDAFTVEADAPRPEGLRQRPRTIVLDPPVGITASIIFYRERKDAPVHAIAAEVWQGGRGKVLSVEPMHCMGLSPAQVVELMTNILRSCASDLGVELTKFAHRIELHPSQCPISPCPLCPSN